jgi:hypothetical protein
MFNTRGRRSRPDIFGIKIDGQRLTLLNLIGAIRYASYIKMYPNVVQAASP